MAISNDSEQLQPHGQVHLGIALDGVGWHPGAWLEPHADSPDPTSAQYWASLVGVAQRGLADFVTIDDSFAPPGTTVLGPPSDGANHPRLDAELIAARVAPVTEHIGLIPTVTTTHTEPFHVASAIATLDYTSHGRAGWQPRVSATAIEAGHFGRREITEPTADELAALRSGGRSSLAVELFDEAADAVEVARRLWDSWEDDAEIRDVPNRRFIDRDKLHYIDFVGQFFSVRGPAITPRPPQGQPVVAALAHSDIPFEFAARAADLVFITPTLNDGPEPIIQQIRAAEDRVGRSGDPLQIYADILVVLDTPTESGAARLARLDESVGAPLLTDAAVYTGDASELVELIASWNIGGVNGVRLRPAVLPDDLNLIADRLIPELQRRKLFRTEYRGSSLRETLGLTVAPANRYAAI